MRRTMQGTLHETEDGRHALSFERTLAHPPTKVWRAITEAEQLRAWFPAVVEFELTRGAKLCFAPTSEQRRRLGLRPDDLTYGEITAVDPPRLLEYTWEQDVLRWELTPVSEQGCLLVFTHISGDRGTAAAHAPGWHAGLEVVEAQLDGQAIDWSPWERSEELVEEYARALG
jgi:uncharacterized protein YndB with AHSA1/START domain